MDPTVIYLGLLVGNWIIFSMTATGRMMLRHPAFWISVVVTGVPTYALFAYFGAIQLLNVLTGLGVIFNAIGARTIIKLERAVQ